MKKVALLIAVLSIVAISFAGNIKDVNTDKKDKKESSQTNSTVHSSISGQIIDEITGEALAGVKVSLVGTTQEVYTDFDGNFTFTSVGTGKNIIKTDYISYKATVHNNVNANALAISLTAL